jgi:hypothetical protein
MDCPRLVGGVLDPVLVAATGAASPATAAEGDRRDLSNVFWTSRCAATVIACAM